MPKALVAGCSVNEFWYGDPKLINAYTKAYELRLKDNVDEWRMKVNFTAWLQGTYIQSAVAAALSKNAHYPQRPFELFSDEISEEQKIANSEEAIRNRSRQIDEMLSKNKRASTQVFCENIE